jgi:lysozyme
MNMDRLVKTLIRHEGAVRKNNRHFPYKDSVGKLTIGFGRNLTDRGLSEDEAQYLLSNDIHEVINDLQNNYHWFNQLDSVRQEVVINMAFNLGFTGFSKFKTTIKRIAEGNYESAAANMLNSKWASQVHGRADELAEMMRTGKVNDKS